SGVSHANPWNTGNDSTGDTPAALRSTVPNSFRATHHRCVNEHPQPATTSFRRRRQLGQQMAEFFPLGLQISLPSRMIGSDQLDLLDDPQADPAFEHVDRLALSNVI